MLHTGAVLLLTPSTNLEGSAGRFLRKGDSQIRNLLRLSSQSMPLRQPDELLQGMHDSDDITSLTLHPEQKIKAPEERALHQCQPRCPPVLPSHATP